jgi:hypothetical protein
MMEHFQLLLLQKALSPFFVVLFEMVKDAVYLLLYHPQLSPRLNSLIHIKNDSLHISQVLPKEKSLCFCRYQMLVKWRYLFSSSNPFAIFIALGSSCSKPLAASLPSPLGVTISTLTVSILIA